jgi:hypothetical protein
MRARLLLLAVSLLAAAWGLQPAPPPPPDPALAAILEHVSEDAGLFRATAPRMLAEETFEQRALKPPRRFRPRLGNAALEPPKPEYRTRTIVSEYGFSTFQDAPNALHELRQVVSVDGRSIASREAARRTLSVGMRSQDDALKKRMLEEFEKHGLRGAVTDFGQILLLFSRRRLEDYTFRLEGSGQVGPDAAIILGFQQRSGAGALLIFEKSKDIHQALEGQLWVRRSDSRPLRVVLRSSTQEGVHVARYEATVDYAVSPRGVLEPVSVLYRQFAGADLMVENLFHYSPFRLFTAESEVKFDEPVPPK